MDYEPEVELGAGAEHEKLRVVDLVHQIKRFIALKSYKYTYICIYIYYTKKDISLTGEQNCVELKEKIKLRLILSIYI